MIAPLGYQDFLLSSVEITQHRSLFALLARHSCGALDLLLPASNTTGVEVSRVYAKSRELKESPAHAFGARLRTRSFLRTILSVLSDIFRPYGLLTRWHREDFAQGRGSVECHTTEYHLIGQ